VEFELLSQNGNSSTLERTRTDGEDLVLKQKKKKEVVLNIACCLLTIPPLPILLQISQMYAVAGLQQKCWRNLFA
jgi:hypothetical protein